MLRTHGDPPLFHQRRGDGTVEVVALHGWGRSHADFDEALAGTSSLALDLPGFGLSPEPPLPWGSAAYAAHVAGLLRTLDAPVVLVGHSFGGRVAVRLAASQPTLVRGLVLVGAPVSRPPDAGPRRRPPLAYRLVRRLAGWGVVPDAVLEQARQRHGSPDYVRASPRMRQVMNAVLAEDYEDDLRRITVPTVLLWGAEDREVRPAVAHRAHELLASSTVEVLDDVGHHVPTQAPAAVAAAVRQVAS